jgi:hypothetical protein
MDGKKVVAAWMREQGPRETSQEGLLVNFKRRYCVESRGWQEVLRSIHLRINAFGLLFLSVSKVLSISLLLPPTPVGRSTWLLVVAVIYSK